MGPYTQEIGAQDISWGHTGASDKVDVVMTKLSLSLQSRRCPCKVDVVLAKSTFFVQSCRCPCKVDVVLTKLSSFFAQS